MKFTKILKGFHSYKTFFCFFRPGSQISNNSLDNSGEDILDSPMPFDFTTGMIFKI